MTQLSVSSSCSPFPSPRSASLSGELAFRCAICSNDLAHIRLLFPPSSSSALSFHFGTVRTAYLSTNHLSFSICSICSNLILRFPHIEVLVFSRGFSATYINRPSSFSIFPPTPTMANAYLYFPLTFAFNSTAICDGGLLVVHQRCFVSPLIYFAPSLTLPIFISLVMRFAVSVLPRYVSVCDSSILTLSILTSPRPRSDCRYVQFVVYHI